MTCVKVNTRAVLNKRFHRRGVLGDTLRLELAKALDQSSAGARGSNAAHARDGTQLTTGTDGNVGEGEEHVSLTPAVL